MGGAGQSLGETSLLICVEHAYSLSTFMKLRIMNMFHQVKLKTKWHLMACDEGGGKNYLKNNIWEMVSSP